MDWIGLLQAGRALGLMPAQVWALTPAELLFLLGRAGGASLTRARLAELSALYPDETGVKDGGE